MDPRTEGASAPTRRVVLAVGSLVAGVILSMFFASVVLAFGDWDFGVSTALGSEVGRIVMQLAQEAELGVRRLPLSVSTLFNVPLWICMVGGPLLARRGGLEWRRDLGWKMKPIDVPVGLAVGAVAQLVLVPLVYVPIFWLIGDQDVGEAARSLAAGADSPLDIAALLVLTGLGAPVIEEILFRGLLHRGMSEMMSDRGRLGTTLAVLGSSSVFAASHVQLLQFPALLMFGAIAAVAVERTGRLGTSIWIHVGFNLTTVTVLLTAF